MSLWLDPIPDSLQQDAVRSLDAGDWLGFLVAAANTESIELVWKNLEQLKARGVYESALLHALTITRTNNARWSMQELTILLAAADRDRLRAAGQPLPVRGPFTLFRGVAGRGAARRVRGLSWSGSEEKARWFAERGGRWGLDDPAVFRVTVEERDVFAYVDDRQEQEFLVLLPASSHPVRIASEKVGV